MTDKSTFILIKQKWKTKNAIHFISILAPVGAFAIPLYPLRVSRSAFKILPSFC